MEACAPHGLAPPPRRALRRRAACSASGSHRRVCCSAQHDARPAPPLWSPQGTAGRAAALAAAAALALAPLPPPAALAALAPSPPAPKAAPRLPAPPLTADERATVALFRSATPSVVFITTLAERKDAFTLDPVETPAGAGSGFFWDSAGHVVTNFHVVKDAAQLRVTLGDASVTPASVVGFDEDRDVAVLQVPPDVAAKATPLPLGCSGDLLVGQRVYAIGNPFGLDHTLTTGVVSGLGREIASGITGRPIAGAIQTDAAINPGNSGGPLLNSGGQVVGINTAIYSSSGTSSGVGFALPSDLVAGVVDQIIRTGKVTRPVIGISFAPDAAVAQLGLGGVLVLEATEGGPAAKAGVHSTRRDANGRLLFGDVIVSIDGKPVKTSSDLYKMLDVHAVGDTLQLGLERMGEPPLTVPVTLEEREPKPAAAAAAATE